MITEHDLQEAIAECNGVRNPTASTAIKLAALYTVKDHLFGAAPQPVYSYAEPPDSTISIDSGSEFASVISGRNQDEIWPIMDELMQTLSAIQPSLYDAVMRKLE